MKDKLKNTSNILFSIFFSLLITFIFDVIINTPDDSSISKLLYYYLGLISIAIVSYFTTSFILEYKNICPNLLKVLKECNISALTKSKIIIFTILNSALKGNEIEIPFNVTCEEYIKFLISGLYFAEKKWETTYTIHLSDWYKYNEHLKEYNNLLKVKDIKKTRYIIPTNETITYKKLEKSLLGQNSKEANITLKVCNRKDVLNNNIEIRDFALADDILAISTIDLKKDFELKNKVKLVITAGKTKAGSYSTQIETFEKLQYIQY